LDKVLLGIQDELATIVVVSAGC